MYKYILCALLVIGVFGTTSDASACIIEDWRWVTTGSYLTIEGSASCESGRVFIRAYDRSGNFLGADSGYIEGHVFAVIMSNVPEPSSVRIKYTIKR